MFSEALKLVPDLTILDHRHHRGSKEFFVSYDHPGEQYFRMLVKELSDRTGFEARRPCPPVLAL